MEKLSFGETIRKRRKEKGLSLKQLAKILNIDFTMLGKIETGERSPNIFSVRAYADALNIDYKELQIHFISERIVKQLKDVDFSVEAIEDAKHTLNNL